jgi:sphinganine-1-phosphate aldolase
MLSMQSYKPLNLIEASLSYVIDYIDQQCEDKKPWQIVALSIGVAVAAILIKNLVFSQDWKRRGTKLLRQLPHVAAKIEGKRKKFVQGLEKSTFSNLKDPIYTLPANGMDEKKILARLNSSSEANSWEKAQVSGAVYHNRSDIKEISLKAFELAFHANPLHAELFNPIRQCEAEIIQWCSNSCHGGVIAAGAVTSGGTESIILACLAARNRGEEVFGIKNPEIIIPTTAHVAFRKAEALLNVKMIEAPVDPITLQVQGSKVKKLINSNTVMIVGSAPQFPYGIVDPIQELSDLVLTYKGRIGLHVDACLGSLLITSMEKAGFPIPPFDFSLPGVTSMSQDPHKYGYTAKGTSVILYRDKEWRKYQYSIHSNWPGGIYGTPTIAGSRSGGITAAAWAAMAYLGEKGYIEATKRIISISRTLKEELKKISEIALMGDPQLSLLAIKSNHPQLNIYQLSDKLKAKHWHLNDLQYPPGIHICLTDIHATYPNFCQEFSKDLKEGIRESIALPENNKGKASLYGEMQKIPTSFADEFVTDYFDVMSQMQLRENYPNSGY